MAIRLSKSSISNLKISESVVLEETVYGCYLVACILDGNRSYLYGTDIIVYPTLCHAKRAVLRHAPLCCIRVMLYGASEAIPLYFAQ